MIDTEILSKHNIHLNENLLYINQKNKKAYVKIKHITAVELDYNQMYISIFFGIIAIIIGLIVPSVNIFGIFKTLLIIMGILSIISAYFYVYVNIYTLGYKPIKIRGSYHSMRDIFEELKKLVVEK